MGIVNCREAVWMRSYSFRSRYDDDDDDDDDDEEESKNVRR